MSLDPNGSSLVGAIWGGITFAFEHPLEVLKVKCQWRPSRVPSQLPQQIYSTNGVKGFYVGGAIGLTSRLIRGTYRWPVVNTLQDHWEAALPKNTPFRESMKNVATATAISGAEVFFVLPFQKLFVAKVNSLGDGRYIPTEFKYNGMRSLYLGAVPNFINYWAGWSTYLVSSHLANQAAAHLDPKGAHPKLDLVGKSLFVGSAMTTLIPLEFLQVHMQNDQSLGNKSIAEVVSTLFQKYGVKGFVSGARFAFVHKCLQFLCGTLFFEQIDRSLAPKH